MRTVLQRRFDMCTWFKRNGFPVDTILENAIEAARQERIRGGAPAAAPGSAAGSPPGSRSSVVAVAKPATPPLQKRAAGSQVRPFLILTDFDKTLTDYDAGAYRYGDPATWVDFELWVANCPWIILLNTPKEQGGQRLVRNE